MGAKPLHGQVLNTISTHNNLLMVSQSRAVSMSETLWDKIDRYKIEHEYSANSAIIQQAVTEFLDDDVTEKNYRLVDIVSVALLFVVILLLMVVIL